MPREIRFLNTMTRRVEVFHPLETGHVRMVQLRPDRLQLRPHRQPATFLFEDVLRRTLQAFGYRVTQVMNLTDIDDKTIKGAAAEGVSLREFTDRYIAAFFQDIDALRFQRAEHYPRATDFIPQQVELVEKLNRARAPYVQGRLHVLPHRHVPRLRQALRHRRRSGEGGHRVDADEYEKEDVRDFVLWKASKRESPHGRRCSGPAALGGTSSALRWRWLSSERASTSTQARSTTSSRTTRTKLPRARARPGRPFSSIPGCTPSTSSSEGQKMAKSLGNFFTLRDLLERGHDPLAIRYLLISVPYRQKLNFTFDGLHAAAAGVERIGNTLRRLAHTPPAAAGRPSWPPSGCLRRGVRRGLADDLNTARALGALHTVF